METFEEAERRPLKKNKFNIDLKHSECWSEFFSKQCSICLMLLLILMLCIEIFKMTIPALPMDEQKQISQAILKSIKKMSKIVKEHYNIPSEITKMLPSTPENFSFITEY